MKSDFEIILNFSQLKNVFFANGISNKKHTRMEAFFRLLSIYRMNIMTEDKREFEIQYKTLAEEWHWDRNTVKKFIELLKQQNMIDIIQNKKNIIINFKCVDTLAPPLME